MRRFLIELACAVLVGVFVAMCVWFLLEHR